MAPRLARPLLHEGVQDTKPPRSERRCDMAAVLMLMTFAAFLALDRWSRRHPVTP